MAKINWTIESRNWLQTIHDYIAKNNPTAAQKTIEGIIDKAEILNDFPEIGYKYLEQPERNLRIILYGHYRITYLIKPNGMIDIIGVFHGSLDIKRYLEK